MIGALRVLESKMHLSGFRFCSVEFLKSELESSLNYSSEEKAQCVCVSVFYLMSICQCRPDNAEGDLMAVFAGALRLQRGQHLG